METRATAKTQAILLLASTMTVMAGAMISPSIPTLQKILVPAPNAFWLVLLTVTIPGLLIALTAPFAGWICDSFGRKGLMILGLILYALSGSSGFYSNALWSILLSRVLLSLGVALVMTGATTRIADLFDGPTRDRVYGMQAAAMRAGGLIFLLSGGWFADLHWQAPVATYLTALFLVPCIWFWMQEPSATVENAQESEMNHSSWRKVCAIYLLAFLGMLTFYLIPAQLPALLIEKMHATPIKAGAAVGFALFFSSLSALLHAQLRPYLSFLSIYGILFFLLGIGFCLFSIAQQLPDVMLGAIFAGLGIGLLFPNSAVWLTNLVPFSCRGRFVGGLSSSIFFGQFLVPLIYQPIVQACGWQGACGAFNVSCFFTLSLAIFLFVISLAQGIVCQIRKSSSEIS